MEYVQHENPDLRTFSIQPGAVETAMQAKSGIPAVDEISKFLTFTYLRLFLPSF
jgi:hypothetical protein